VAPGTLREAPFDARRDRFYRREIDFQRRAAAAGAGQRVAQHDFGFRRELFDPYQPVEVLTSRSRPAIRSAIPLLVLPPAPTS